MANWLSLDGQPIGLHPSIVLSLALGRRSQFKDAHTGRVRYGRIGCGQSAARGAGIRPLGRTTHNGDAGLVFYEQEETSETQVAGTQELREGSMNAYRCESDKVHVHTDDVGFALCAFGNNSCLAKVFSVSTPVANLKFHMLVLQPS